MEDREITPCYIRARRPDGRECTIDLLQLETALDGSFPGQYYLLPETGKLVAELNDDDDDCLDEDEALEKKIPEGAEVLELDALESRARFRWMEQFISSVHSITARSTLSHAIRMKRPFRSFKDALMEYPEVRKQWFQFEAQKLTQEAIQLIESFDWEVLQVVDSRPKVAPQAEADPSDRIPLTDEEYEWIVRGASEIASKGGRTQLSLLLKGSKDKRVLQHDLDRSPAYGKLSFLTIEEIENRIDRIIRQGDLEIHYFGDLPLIVLSDEAWERVRPWSNEKEVTQAAALDDKALHQIVLEWRNRPRTEQAYLLDAMASLDQETGRRILIAWRRIAGKDIRARIEERLGV